MTLNNVGVVVREMTVKVKDGRSERTILNRLNLTAEPGKITAITGPSGCGKTTLLSCIAGVAKFQGGRAFVGDQLREPNQLATAAELRKLGIIFQDYRLVKSLSVADNVALTLQLKGFGWNEARGHARRILSMVGLAGRGNDRPSSLSGGEQQRVALARAIIGEPDVILADEPSAHLDKDSASMLIGHLIALSRLGVTVVVSTHDTRLLDSCDQVIGL